MSQPMFDHCGTLVFDTSFSDYLLRANKPSKSIKLFKAYSDKQFKKNMFTQLHLLPTEWFNEC